MIVWAISLDLKLIGSIISANVSTKPLPPITQTLAYAVYLNQLVDGIRDILCKPKLTEDSIWNIHLHNLKID